MFEFKYYTTTPTQKRVLFDALQALPFRVRCVALDKSKLPVDWARLSGQALTGEINTPDYPCGRLPHLATFSSGARKPDELVFIDALMLTRQRSLSTLWLTR